MNTENIIKSYFIEKKIYPFSVLFSEIEFFLKISFYLESDIEELKELIDYRSMCDKTGFLEFPSTNTIILKDMCLTKFIKIVNEYNKTI